MLTRHLRHRANIIPTLGVAQQTLDTDLTDSNCYIGYTRHGMFYPYGAGIDISRQNRQILTSKVDPRTERVKICIVVLDS